MQTSMWPRCFPQTSRAAGGRVVLVLTAHNPQLERGDEPLMAVYKKNGDTFMLQLDCLLSYWCFMAVCRLRKSSHAFIISTLGCDAYAPRGSHRAKSRRVCSFFCFNEGGGSILRRTSCRETRELWKQDNLEPRSLAL